MPVPPLFRIIQEQASYDWKEMYRVFNMGHRLEIYTTEEIAREIIKLSQEFHINAQIIGYCESASKASLTIRSEFGDFDY